MHLRPFVPHDDIKDIPERSNEVYPEANAVEGAAIFDENLPPTQTKDEEPEEKITAINHQSETPTFSDIHAREVNARRMSVKRDSPQGRHRFALTRTQHTPSEKDEYHDERVSCTLSSQTDQICKKKTVLLSHTLTTVEQQTFRPKQMAQYEYPDLLRHDTN